MSSFITHHSSFIILLMEEIQYFGEHLAPGRLGHLALILGFTASLLASLGYFFATQRREKTDFAGWRKIGRFAFTLHGVCVLGVIGAIFFVMINKYYEYQYVWAHISEELQFRYIFSAFWEGQEGSFLLWMFWHVVLGMVILVKGKQWEAPVLSVLALIQAFIFTMILGIYIGPEAKIGSNPLLLLREIPEWMNLPIFNNADYVSLISGNGLNPLLQNYWMTIHPPTLFLGFASTSIPFCFAIAGLWTNQHRAWLKPALPWALFSAAVLGTGILMGGVWAYEALTFGGYWAWDPVENMSLVPWIVLVAGIHTNLVARNTRFSVKSTYLFYLLTFVLISYSTFLTRSGVLGDSSVHAFTDMGLEWQLVGFIGFFALLGGLMFGLKNKNIPAPEKEEATASREFWMFIGGLVLLFSAAMITASTSLPVYNKIRQFFDPAFDGITITDPVTHYNKYQLWIAVFVALISGGAQYLRYREFNWKSHSKKFLKPILTSAGIAIVLTLFAGFWINVFAWQYWLLLFSGMFALIANLNFLLAFLKGNMKLGAGALAHAGFGILVVGVMASGLNKEHISTNPVAQAGMLDEEMLQKNVMLFKGVPMFMSGYEVTYKSDTLIGKERFYEVTYKKVGESGKVAEEFTVRPSALYDNNGMKVAAYNPSTKHYFHKDIFTHIATLPLREADLMEARKFDDTLSYDLYHLKIGEETIIFDTVQTESGPQIVGTKATLLSVNYNPQLSDYQSQVGDLAVGIRLALAKEDTTFYAEPAIVLRDQLLYTFPAQINDLSMKVRLTPEIIDQILIPEKELNYKLFNLKQGESFDFKGNRVTFSGFNKEPEHPNYQKEEGDIAIGGRIEIMGKDQKSYFANPLYLIRGRNPSNYKDVIYELGLHFRFSGLDPDTESIDVMVAQKDRIDVLPVEISKRSFRTDFIVLEAIIFPGINLVWLGSILMMVGLSLGMWNRARQKRQSET